MTTRTTIWAAAVMAALLCGVVWGSGTEYRPPPSMRVQPKRDRAADFFAQGKQAADAGKEQLEDLVKALKDADAAQP